MPRLSILALMFALLSGPTTSTMAQECLPAPEGLVSWWPGDGDALDVEGNNDGTVQGGVTFDTGQVNESFDFNGLDGYVVIQHSPSLHLTTNLTVSLWMNSRQLARRTGIVTNHMQEFSPRTGFVLILRETGAVLWQLRTDGLCCDNLFSKSMLSVDTWYHLAGTYDGSQMRLFINGVEDAASPVAANGSIDSTEDIWVGNNIDWVLRDFPGDVASFAFDGFIDEITIYDRTLSTAEIAAIYDAGSAGKCKDEDGDGFRPPEDCDETDPMINPGGTELPGNFIDEDCNGDLGDCSPCNAWRNHGEYVRCVSQTVETLVDGGVLTPEEGDALVSAAARSDIGKKGFVAPECE